LRKACEIDPIVKGTFEPLINEAKTKRQLSPPGQILREISDWLNDYESMRTDLIDCHKWVLDL